MKRFVALTSLVVLFAAPARSSEPSFEVDATMTCPDAPGLGRVRCDAGIRAPGGARISWADLIIVQTPPHITALKARIPPSDVTEARDETWRWALAVVAKSRGKGEMHVRVRAVVCRENVCVPITKDLSVSVSAGE